MEIVYISFDDENDPPANFSNEPIPTENDVNNADGPKDTASEENLVAPMNNGKCSNDEHKPETSHVNATSSETNAVVIDDTNSESRYPSSSQSSNSLFLRSD